LIIQRQLRSLGQRRVEDAGIGLCQQQASRIAAIIANDFASRRIWRVFGVTDRSQCGSIEQSAIVEVQQEDRRIRRNGVQLFDGGKSFLGELMLGEAADHPHPLRWRRHRNLSL